MAQAVMVSRIPVASIAVYWYNWQQIMLCGNEPRFSSHLVHV